MALSVSGFPEPLRQLDTDDSSLNPLQRGLSLFAKKRQNTDDVPDPSPISMSSTDEFAQMAILQPPPVIPPSLAPRPRQISLTRRTPPPPQRQPSLGRLEIGSRPSLPKPPSAHEPQPPTLAHPRPLPAVPAPVPQGPIIESSKSAALRAAAQQAPVQPQSRPPPSRVLLPGPSRPRAQTTLPHVASVRYQAMAVEPTETPGASSSSSSSTPTPTPSPPNTASFTATTPGPSGPRPLPRVPPVSVGTPSTSTAPIPPAPLSAAPTASSSQLQPPYVPSPPRAKRPKTSPSLSAPFAGPVRPSPFDAVPSSWASRPVDLNPTGPSGSGSASSSASISNPYASASGANAAHASGSGSSSNTHASGSGTSSSGASSSASRSLPRPRSHSRTRDQSAEASGSRSRGAASPIRYVALASGSSSAPLPSSSGSGSASGSGRIATPPSSRRGSTTSTNPPTPRSSVPAANGGRTPESSPRIPSLPPPKLTTRVLPSTTKVVEESAITSVSAITVTTRSPPTPTSPRSHSVGHPTSILKNSKSRTAKRTLALHNVPPEPSGSEPPKKSTSLDSAMDVDVHVDMGLELIRGADESGPFVSRSPSPIRYARSSSRDSLLDTDDDAHPNTRSRPRSRSQLRSFRRSYRPKPPERSPSPIAYARRCMVDPGGIEPEMLFDDEDDDGDDLGLGFHPRRKHRRHTQPRSYQFEFKGPAPDIEQEKDKVWKDLGVRKESKESKEWKETKEGGAWDSVWKNAVGASLVRKRSKSKASAGQTNSKDSGTTSGGSVIDISSPTAITITTAYTREFTPNYSNPSLNSRESGEHSVGSHTSSAMLSGKQSKAKKPRRPFQPPSTPPAHLPNSSVQNTPRTRTMSEVSSAQRHARAKSDGGHGHKTRLSGVFPGVSWGAEVNTEVNTEQWSSAMTLTPLRRAPFAEVEQTQGTQDVDMDMVQAIPVLRRLKART
ncbi:hypothetical protein H0H87_006967 [Tephrocybe sp. NHM501043]|nr:hypothetical protein H0H87_006967 [Tephrocybe sp. NHM501043]